MEQQGPEQVLAALVAQVQALQVQVQTLTATNGNPDSKMTDDVDSDLEATWEDIIPSKTTEAASSDALKVVKLLASPSALQDLRANK